MAEPKLTIDDVRALAHEIATQDNEITDEPYMLVQVKEREYGYDPAWADNHVWIDSEGDEAEPKLARKLDSGAKCGDWTKTAYKDRWRTVQASITRKGAEDYIRVNGHNHRGEKRVYVESAYRNYEIQRLRQLPALFVELFTEGERVREQLAELQAQRDTPELHDFVRGVVLEAQHQRARWGSDHDAGKQPADWFWLLGYLGGKALAAAIGGNTEKALHHCISSAAALANWHAALNGTSASMRPGTVQEGEVAHG